MTYFVRNNDNPNSIDIYASREDNGTYVNQVANIVKSINNNYVYTSNFNDEGEDYQQDMDEMLYRFNNLRNIWFTRRPIQNGIEWSYLYIAQNTHRINCELSLINSILNSNAPVVTKRNSLTTLITGLEQLNAKNEQSMEELQYLINVNPKLDVHVDSQYDAIQEIIDQNEILINTCLDGLESLN